MFVTTAVTAALQALGHGGDAPEMKFPQTLHRKARELKFAAIDHLDDCCNAPLMPKLVRPHDPLPLKKW
jgi:hypothetical protein